jgi:hypothetical protein
MSGAPEVRRFRLYIFFALKRKKVSDFLLSFSLSKYEQRTLGAPVLLIYFFRFKAKKSLIFRLLSL